MIVTSLAWIPFAISSVFLIRALQYLIVYESTSISLRIETFALVIIWFLSLAWIISH